MADHLVGQLEVKSVSTKCATHCQFGENRSVKHAVEKGFNCKKLQALHEGALSGLAFVFLSSHRELCNVSADGRCGVFLKNQVQGSLGSYG